MSYFDRNGRYLGISSKKNLTSPKKSVKFKGKKFEASKSLNRRKKMREQSYSEGDLSRLGYREIGLLAELLDLWADQKLTQIAKGYFGDLKTFGFNTNSGNVFLIDDNYNVLMTNGGELDLWITTPYEGKEGFPDEFEGTKVSDYSGDDADYLQDLGIQLEDDEEMEDEETED